MHVQVMIFDGPRSTEAVAASSRAGRDRITPLVDSHPGLREGLLGGLRCVAPDGAECVVVLARDAEALDILGRVVMSSELLPGEDPALLTGPDRGAALHDDRHLRPAGGDARAGRPMSARSADVARLTAGQWAVAPGVARFSVRDKVFATVHGTLPVEDGAVSVDADGQVGHAWVRLAVRGVATGNALRDRTLMAPSLLDGERFPTITVTTTAGSAAAALGPDGSVVAGTLLAKGVRAPVTLTARVVEAADDVVRLRVNGRLDRRPIGIRAPSVLIGRYVDLDAELTLRRGGEPS